MAKQFWFPRNEFDRRTRVNNLRLRRDWTLAIDTEPHYVDTLALAPGTSAIWKYRALYLDGDQPFGQWSDTVQIAVQG